MLNKDPKTNSRAKIEYSVLLDSSDGKVKYGVTVYVSGPALKAMLEAAESDGFDAAALNRALSELDQNHHVAMENFIQETEAYYSEMRKRTKLKSREEIDDLLKQLLSRRRAQITQTDDSLLSTHRIYQKSVLVPSKSKLKDNMTKNIRKFNTYLDGLLKPGAFVARNDKAVEIVINLH